VAATAADQKPGCSADGRYWMHHDRGQKIYCFDGDSFPEGELPKHVKEFFEPPKPNKGGNVGADAPAPIGSSSGPPAQVSRKPSARSSSSSGDPQPANDSDITRGKSSRQDTNTTDVVRTSSPEESTLDGKLIQDIQIGMDRKAVLEKLGKPQGAVMNVSSDGIVHILTYVTTQGNASIQLRENRVVLIRRPR
jgi:hypothetical protein